MRRDPFAEPEELVRRLYAYVAYAIGDGPDAEDVTSEAFERGLRYRGSYDPSKGAPLTWLVAIARRCLADLAARPQPLPVEEVPDRPSREDLEGDALLRVELAAAVARLPERDRELVALRYGADLTARQIAALLEVRPNAVEVALHRLHARLRVELAGDVSSAAATRERVGKDPARAAGT